MFYIGGRGFVCQIIELVTFARCAFIFALQNIALGGYLDTRRNINFRTFTARRTRYNYNYRKSVHEQTRKLTSLAITNYDHRCLWGHGM